MITISNEQLSASFKTRGAELCSLKDTNTGIEYIWQGDPKHWNRHAPVLFPFVGKLKDDTYHADNISYHLGQHGFARDSNFETLKRSKSSVAFILRSNPITLEVFPYSFELIISYELHDRRLDIRYDVGNPSLKDVLYFSIGGHPAFNCPHLPGKNRSDYKLIFEKPETAEKHLLIDGNFSGETKAVPLENRELKITDDLFDEDALVFKGLDSSHVSLHDDTSEVLKFNFSGFPYLGIWSKSSKSPFVCIEPWFGLADHVDHSGNIQDKEGIQSLDPHQSFSCLHSVEIY